MFKNVLIAIDLTHPESWEKALPMAKTLCAGGGTLHVLTIMHDLGNAMIASYLPKGFETDALQRMKADLDAFVSEKVGPDVTARAHVGHGHVPEHILSTAKQIGADVIVMASYPPDDLRSVLIGSNAGKVVRHADRPVLVVR